MRRRIERSRARCEKHAPNGKCDKAQESDKQPKLTNVTSVERDEKAG
jgi:hypothetical protein